MIYIISPKNNAILTKSLKLNKKNTWVELLPLLPKEYSPQKDDQIYIDISGQGPSALKKILTRIKKAGVFWGIIDPKGTAMDPASFFFDGAADYMGPNLIKKGLGKKRFTEALSWIQNRTDSGGTAGQMNATPGGFGAKKKDQKLPAGKFKGWKSIRSGTSDSFFFLFVSLSEKSNLRAMVGEAGFTSLKNRLRDVLQQNFREADALLWMETEENNLLLVPPRVSNGKAAVEAALKMILNSKLIGIEKLGLSIPVEFTFALHFGKTVFQAPGKTGCVISESVNYIFHLGAKKAESGRLTISGDIPDAAIPEGLRDMFRPNGEFEGIPISHSRRFVCKY